MTQVTLSPGVWPKNFLANGLPQVLFHLLFFFAFPLAAQTSSNLGTNTVPPTNLLVMIQGKVEVAPSGTDAWAPGRRNQILHPGDRVRTGERSRAEVYLISGVTIQKSELSELEIPPTPGVHFLKGLFKVLNRKWENSDFNLHNARAAIRGTDFLVLVTEDKSSELTVLDGKVLLTNDAGGVLLTNYERGLVMVGSAPRKTAVIEASESKLIQWSLYYPGVINADELELSAAERGVLMNSLNAYRQGDLIEAVARYPWSRPPESEAGTVYQAALLLSVGQVEKATALLEPIKAFPPAQALEQLIAAVRLETWQPSHSPRLSSEWIAESYYRQSRNQLEEALAAAKAAVSNAPAFGFAWERVAELEFSFGRREQALAALEKSLQLSQRNAQALALKGFLLASENRISAASSHFEQAIAIDSALGNAWLGRGLCLIRQGRQDEGLRDLMVAASLESQRSLLRSYLGKAFADAGDDRHAVKELELAKNLDPNDPTGWLYSALLKQRQNRVNEAISDLEASQERNDNRSLFRSRLLLEEDRAVRSANLASIYGDAGMIDVSVREASRAVTADYANYSAHLFLANSFNQLRDPNLINLRYETATFSEYLIANLLSPVGGTALSPYVSQQEYSKLFATDRIGLSSETTYSSRGDWQQQASQFGSIKNSAYALDVFYQSRNGNRPNNDLEQQAYSVQFKQQLSPKDSVYLQGVFNDVRSGDVRQYYDQGSADPALRINETQQPNLFLGYHREWSPNSHTLFLAGRLEDKFTLSDRNILIRDVARDNSGQIVDSAERICNTNDCDIFDSLRFRSKFEAYSAELQQILEFSAHTLIGGARFQDGNTDLHSTESRSRGSIVVPFRVGPGGELITNDFVAIQQASTDLRRLSLYAYDQWNLFDDLWLTAGLSYDRLHYPINADSPPVSSVERTESRLSPKAGFIWRPAATTTVRGAYAQSFGGLFYDTSVRLEPVQIAGFTQAYRSLIPESVQGGTAGSQFETFHVGMEQAFKSKTYFTLQAELLRSDASRDIGVFDFDLFGAVDPSPSQIRQRFEYEEKSLSATINQLVGRDWSLGVRYKFSEAELETKYPDVSSTIIRDTRNSAILHEVNLFAIYNHPIGVFGQCELLWKCQSNKNYDPDIPGDEFGQLNLAAGYRFANRQGEITFAVLNVAGQDYRLNPLSLYNELPRDRTFVARLKFNF